jgi:hypothetical protein
MTFVSSDPSPRGVYLPLRYTWTKRTFWVRSHIDKKRGTPDPHNESEEKEAVRLRESTDAFTFIIHLGFTAVPEIGKVTHRPGIV